MIASLLLAEMTTATVVWMIVLAVILLGMLAAVLVIRVQLNAWKVFARRHGLACESKDGHRRVVGKLDGRDFELTMMTGSADSPPGKETLRMGIKLPGAPPGLLIQRAGESASQTESASLGDAEFDAVFVTTAGNATEIQSLTENRRVALRRLAEEYPECDVILQQGQLALQRQAPAARRILEDWLTGLRSAADAWDGNSSS